jgi:hypothetical protein
MKTLDNFKVIVGGGVIATLMLVIGYVVYTQVNIQPTSTKEYLDGSIYVTLKRFKNENVDFKNMKNIANDTFNSLQNTRVDVPVASPNGRANPFAP